MPRGMYTGILSSILFAVHWGWEEWEGQKKVHNDCAYFFYLITYILTMPIRGDIKWNLGMLTDYQATI